MNKSLVLLLDYSCYLWGLRFVHLYNLQSLQLLTKLVGTCGGKITKIKNGLRKKHFNSRPPPPPHPPIQS